MIRFGKSKVFTFFASIVLGVILCAISWFLFNSSVVVKDSGVAMIIKDFLILNLMVAIVSCIGFWTYILHQEKMIQNSLFTKESVFNIIAIASTLDCFYIIYLLGG